MQYLEATTKRCSLNYAFFKTSEKRYKHITMTSSYEGCKIAAHHMHLKKKYQAEFNQFFADIYGDNFNAFSFQIFHHYIIIARFLNF